MTSTRQKLARLRGLLQQMDSVLVTFSGGADSTFLAKVAYDVLGRRAAALTAVSASLPASELEEAKKLAAAIGIEHLLIESKELGDPRYASNPMNRCYFCKSELFALACAEALRRGFSFVADGTQQDDLRDVRPGRQAAKEWRVRSPLVEAGLTKAEIRGLSREMGLSTWDKPAAACLASRLPTGTAVTVERLSQVERAEAALKELGFRQLRARYQAEAASAKGILTTASGPALRLEFDPEELPRLASAELRANVVQACQQVGFKQVFVDLAGRPSR